MPVSGELKAGRLRPPTDEEMEIISQFTVAAFAAAVVTIAAVLIYSAYLLLRTKLPGRIEVFLGSLLFALFFSWAQYMGGYLELTLGPFGILLEVLFWSTSAALLMVGHFRMLRNFRRNDVDNNQGKAGASLGHTPLRQA